ncbi:non-ribosomal peptide synthetase [Lysinibacillus sp. ZYM-1]|uniref:non-ribosomal peptide synthetase n=1 Tax=Lysinibacillus sp. ZYM-1 TaxID=1681184 RepID=UPI0006CE974A|nr:non-ribosomal peptide synthetase [Lysinibacillus sp. ZYM-1]KPN96586.1 peptide synthetase [Lysinibacillus sp. ZYM-1]
MNNKREFDFPTSQFNMHFSEQETLLSNHTQLLNKEDTLAYQTLNHTLADYDKNITVPEVFYQVAQQFADRIALSYEDGGMTYRQLNEQSNQVAHMLIAKGLQKGDYVAIMMERSRETVISLLGVLKAGGVYVPIDPSYPKERCQYLLNDTGAPFIITKNEHSALLNDFIHNDSQLHTVLTINQMESDLSQEDLQCDLLPSDLAYIIYTSGSTGKPKGVMLKHEAVINLITDNQRIYHSTEEDVFSQFISYSFDPSVTETFTAFFSGARLHMLTSIERLSIEAFADMIAREQVTTATVPNAFFTQLATHLPIEYRDKLTTLQYLSVGGEALLPAIVQKWQEKFGYSTEIINVYGPTECTVLSSYFKINSQITDMQSSIPIGKPIANYEMYVVNTDEQLCPVHVTGELCIAGAGLAAGYLHQPEKTAEVFVPHLFKPEQKMYRTGDLVRLLPSGVIEFVGRKDSQIKVRGFRIELGEIETVLSNHPSIQESVIIAKKMSDGNNHLFAYFTVASGMQLEEDVLRDYLANLLPDYMVPERFIELPEMPLSPTGKIDRKHLATMEVTLSRSNPYVAPENDTQHLLANAWEYVLGINPIGIHDNFFHIGGHSLKVLEILVQVKRHIPFLKIQDFFQYQTIAELDQYIRSYQPEDIDVQELPANLVFKDLMEPSQLSVSQTVKPLTMTTVLLTGSTGYLGSHVLYELLVSTKAHIYCLIRPSEKTTLEGKLMDSMQFYFGHDIARRMKDRITVVQGDLGRKKLDLTSADEQVILEEIDAIIHCGADVRHFGATDHFNNVNVNGTRYLLEIAKHKPGVHFHYVSTIGIPEELAAIQWGPNEAQGNFNYDAKLHNVYTQSKLEAENLVRNAVHDAIPVSIYRVGNLSCHSETGKFQRNIDDNAFYRMIKAMLYLGKTPTVQWHVDFTPINYASQALVSLANQPAANGHVFHLCNPVSLTYLEFIDMIKELGYDLQTMSKQEYTNWLLHGEHSKEEQENLSLAIAQLEGDGASDSPFIFNCKKTIEFLANTSIECAVPNTAFIHRMIEYGVETGYFPKLRQVNIR